MRWSVFRRSSPRCTFWVQKKLHQGENNLEPFLRVKHTAYEPSGSGILTPHPRPPVRTAKMARRAGKQCPPPIWTLGTVPLPSQMACRAYFPPRSHLDPAPFGAGLRLRVRAVRKGFPCCFQDKLRHSPSDPKTSLTAIHRDCANRRLLILKSLSCFSSLWMKDAILTSG